MSQRFVVPPTFGLLQSGQHLDPRAFLAYKTYGTLNQDRSNAVLWPSCYSQRTADMAGLIGEGRRFDPTKLFVVTVDMPGNGSSFSPATPGVAWPAGGLTYRDNARMMHLLLRELGVERLALLYGFSMGAMLAFEYCVQFPDAVAAAVAVCGSARTGPANSWFLTHLADALRADLQCELDGTESRRIVGFHGDPRPEAMKNFAGIYADWIFDAPRPEGTAVCPNSSRPEFARSVHGPGRAWVEGLYKPLGPSASLEEFARNWERGFSRWDALEYYEVSDTWLRGDVSDNEVFDGDLAKALGSIKALVHVMPGSTDQYFRAEEIVQQARLIPKCVYEILESPMGHAAESQPECQPQIDAAIKACLAANRIATQAQDRARSPL